jgi:hypothetical protein
LAGKKGGGKGGGLEAPYGLDRGDVGRGCILYIVCAKRMCIIHGEGKRGIERGLGEGGLMGGEGSSMKRAPEKDYSHIYDLCTIA